MARIAQFCFLLAACVCLFLSGCTHSNEKSTPTPITISTVSLPNGQVNVAYSATLAASGGTAPYSWSLISGALPAMLSLGPASGVISGTPIVAVTNAALTFMVSDSSSPVMTKTVSLTLTIAPPPIAITTTSLPNGQVNAAYSATLAASGGTTPYSWTLMSGTLPTLLGLNATSGAISGTPNVAVTNTPLTFTVKDSSTPQLSKSASLTLTIAPPPIVISTTTLPDGIVGTAYSATLAATGGTAPITWSLTNGALPAGLSLDSASGGITGVPTVSVTNTPLTFMATDSSTPQLTKSVSVTLTIAIPAGITVSVSPARAGLTSMQALPVTATTNDNLGVNWTASGGGFSSSSSANGTAVTYTAAATAGSYTITATAISDPSKSSTSNIYVTSLGGVYTYHNDLSRDGVNSQEFALTTANVNTTTFGKLFSCTVDGAIYTQPLWVSSLTVGGAKHNVVFVATQHDSLYAFDADANPCVQLWKVSLIDGTHGGTTGETSVPSGMTGYMVGQGDGDITPEVGVTGTPVIDPSTNTLYVVSKSVNATGPTFFQRLHAIDLATGNEKFSGPANISGTNVTYAGTGDGGTTVAFSPQQENQRCGLALVNGVVYVAWASHEDTLPYYGWVVGFNPSTLAITNILNVSPNVQYGGIWMSGGAPSADNAGSLYMITGNAAFDATNASAPNNDYGDSFLQMSGSLNITSYFTPSDQSSDNANDQDFGSGGAAVVVNVSSGTLKHLVIGGGKDGGLYLLNGDSMGGLGDSNARQLFNIGNKIFSTGAFWNNSFYIAGVHGPLITFAFNTSTNMFSTAITSHSTTTYGFPGATPSVSANGTTNGIVWTLENETYCTNGSVSCGPSILHAYDATTLFNDLWNSSMVAGDVAGNAVKFTVPTVANGKVYVGTRGNNTGGAFGSTTVSGELDVYGLKPN